jgi:hypothetical protein
LDYQVLLGQVALWGHLGQLDLLEQQVQTEIRPQGQLDHLVPLDLGLLVVTETQGQLGHQEHLVHQILILDLLVLLEQVCLDFLVLLDPPEQIYLD